MIRAQIRVFHDAHPAHKVLLVRWESNVVYGGSVGDRHTSTLDLLHACKGAGAAGQGIDQRQLSVRASVPEMIAGLISDQVAVHCATPIKISPNNHQTFALEAGEALRQV